LVDVSLPTVAKPNNVINKINPTIIEPNFSKSIMNILISLILSRVAIYQTTKRNKKSP